MEIPKQIGDFYLEDRADTQCNLQALLENCIGKHAKGQTPRQFAERYPNEHFSLLSYEFLDGGIGTAQLVFVGKYNMEETIEPVLFFVEETDGHCEEIRSYEAEILMKDQEYGEEVLKDFIRFVEEVNKRGEYHELVDEDEYKNFVRQYW